MTPARGLLAWAPAAILGLAATFTVGIDTQRSLPLRSALDGAIPVQILGFSGHDQKISDAERRVAGVTNYLLRNFEPAAAGPTPWFQVYIGYYDRQTQGKTIHSPKNCLPGSGWEPLASRAVVIQTPDGPVRVNRYLLKNKDEQALVLYWYQGRGRVEANEYVVKWDLLRDAALHRRTEEALVRIVIPLTPGNSEADGFAMAAKIAGTLVPAVRAALPT